MTGTTQEEIGPSHTVLGSVIGHTKADPGYLATSRFVLEAGICLATQVKPWALLPALALFGQVNIACSAWSQAAPAQVLHS